MPRLFLACLVSAVAGLSTTGLAFAHDAANPFRLVEANARIERAAGAFHEKVAAAEKAGVPAKALQNARFVVFVDLAWSKHDITVCFWNGTTELQDFIMQKAQVWSDAADINFIYQTNGQNNICQDATSADIRINLDPHAPKTLFVNQEANAAGDWSYLGRVSLNTKFLVTMNLQDVDEARTQSPIWALHAVRHEFGHALALMHEHQRALCNPWFNFQKIAEQSGWTVDFAKEQVGKFPDFEIQYLAAVGGYDQQSIMQYNFPADEFIQIPGKTNPCLRTQPIDNLSPQDIKGIQVLYGPRLGAGAAMQRKALPAMIPASTTAGQVDALRAALMKTSAELQADASGTNRSAKSTGDAKQKAAAFSDVLASVNEIEGMIPPR